MIADIVTVARKELREYAWSGTGARGGKFGLLILLFVFGVVLPGQNGAAWLRSPLILVAWAWVPLMLVAGVVADSFAGERERHTLETLLASRLPDRAILIGKVAAAVAYGWGFTLLTAAVSLISVNIIDWQGQFVLFPAVTAVAVPVFSLLTALAASAAGVLISLRAPTARQAGQTLSVGVMLLLFVPMFGVRALPAGLRASWGLYLAGLGAPALLAGVAVLLVLLDAALIAAALGRFRRARLVLD
ncbi:MAG TPA: ABC transporter permease [Vicinamibacterales bacterium]|nr:ABC transporter permease [Vicinamibacterales bacterium]